MICLKLIFFPNQKLFLLVLQGLIFTETSIHSLQQINALSALRKLDTLTINHEGNPITNYTLWRHYTLFRLSHFSLRKINDVKVIEFLFVVCLLVCLFVHLFVCLFVCSFVYLFVLSYVCLFVYLLARLFVCLFVHLFVCLFVRLFVRSFVCLLVCSFVYLFVRSFVCLFVFVLVMPVCLSVWLSYFLFYIIGNNRGYCVRWEAVW